ncbi:CCHC-type domain-containing protein [Trichonephila clavipes]|nr:CCHC-type domain-containing protein [Trichonephila clavipes]
MPSPAFRREYTVLHTKCIRTLPRGKSSDERRRKVSHLMKGVAEDIYQALLTKEINDTASFIKWCNYIEDMKQKKVGRPRFERLPNVVPVASLTDETDLVSLIRTIVREEVHRLVNQTQESLDSDPQSLEVIVQDELKRAPVQKFPPEPRKTDVWRTADNRPVCFHCGRPGHVMRYCRERLSLTTLETADGTSTTLALKKKYADQTLLAVLRQVPREADPQYVVTDPRRHIADPVSRQAVGARKLRRATFQGGEAACTGNPPSTAKMTGNQLDVIIDKKPIRALVDSGASFSVISDKYRRFLKKVLFADAKSVMLKVADGNLVRPIGNDGTFLEASQAVIDCGQNELVLEDICRDSTAPDAWNLVSPTERRIIHEEVQKMLDEGIVQPSESPWSSPIVLVRKKTVVGVLRRLSQAE